MVTALSLHVARKEKENIVIVQFFWSNMCNKMNHYPGHAQVIDPAHQYIHRSADHMNYKP